MNSDENSSNKQGQPDLVQAALFGRCPRCGAKTLFEAPAQLAIKCAECELPFAELEGSGRFAGMFTAIIAILLIMLATGLDMWLRPPFWLQLALWLPLTAMVVLASLRVFKTLPMLAAYQRRYCTEDE